MSEFAREEGFFIRAGGLDFPHAYRVGGDRHIPAKEAVAILNASVAQAVKAAVEEAVDKALDDHNEPWVKACHRIGEEFCLTGPEGYYDMPSDEWLSWALKAWKEAKDKAVREAVDRVWEEAASMAEECGLDIGCNALEAEGIVRKIRNSLASMFRSRRGSSK